MSEFKFACPVCGQHITADSKDSGSQIPCPTCFRKIVVPQAPASSDPKFVLAASEANKPRPPQASAPAALEPIEKKPVSTPVPIALVVLLGLACIAGITLFAFHGKIFPKQDPKASEATEEAPPSSPAAARRVADTNVYWTMEFGTNVVFPDETAFGKINQKEFSCDRAIFAMQTGQMTLRSGRSGPVEFGLQILFSVRQPQDLAGRRIRIRTNDAVAPKILLKWKEADQAVTGTFNGGYTMRLEFGALSGNRLPGKIYICLPDESKSYIVGNFSAEIRKPPAPKPATPPPR